MSNDTICGHCAEPLLPEETRSPALGDPMHYECGLRAVIGSVAHQRERCACFRSAEAAEEEDPQLTARENAQAAALYFMRRQTADYYVVSPAEEARAKGWDGYRRLCAVCAQDLRRAGLAPVTLRPEEIAFDIDSFSGCERCLLGPDAPSGGRYTETEEEHLEVLEAINRVALPEKLRRAELRHWARRHAATGQPGF